MTVSSLWTVLDKAECGKNVGASEFSGEPSTAGLNPWNVNDKGNPRKPKPKVLAVDLSIWICESLTAKGLVEQNKNPALHLVFSRTLKLLLLGCKLVFVVEGKRRVQELGEDDKFRRRRSGSTFWKACEQCQEMLQGLGVVVVRAKAEAEALCALLSNRNIVDGVITNDGDCFLFGAKVVYTKFSLENLANGTVMRYDLNELRSNIEVGDDPNIPRDLLGNLPLSRFDLISFALLTGSDLAGAGLPKVGHKKAIRFIRKCQLDYPLSLETAAIDEMKSWATAAKADGAYKDPPAAQKGGKCCSRCCHKGSKRNHLKNGCELCGTKPGEPCFEVTSEERFRQKLREKALAQVPKFEPSNVVAAYVRPNENQLPLTLVNATAASISMKKPDLNDLMKLEFVIKGQTLAGSREHIARSVGRVLCQRSLQKTSDAHVEDPSGLPQKAHHGHPVPKCISKRTKRDQVSCYVMTWSINATVTDDYGEGIDGFEFSTVEPCSMIEKRFPKIVESFKEAEKEKMKQGDGEKLRRREFLEAQLCGSINQNAHNDGKKRKITKKRNVFFENNPNLPPRERKRRKIANSHGVSIRDEARQLLQIIVPKVAGKTSDEGISPHRNVAPEKVFVLEDSKSCCKHARNKACVRRSNNRAEYNERQSPKVTKKRGTFFENDTNLQGERKRREKANNQGVAMRDEARQLIQVVMSKVAGNACDQGISPLSNRAPESVIVLADSTTFSEPARNKLGGSHTCAGLVCHMGRFAIAMSPILSNRGAFPPRHIFVHTTAACPTPTRP